MTRENSPEPAWAAFLAGHGPGDVITATPKTRRMTPTTSPSQVSAPDVVAAVMSGRAPARPARVHISRLDGRTFVVVTENPIDNDGPQPFPVATRITDTGGKVTAMQQYRDDRSVADT